MPGTVVLGNQGGECVGYAAGDSLTCKNNTGVMNTCDCEWVAARCGGANHCAVDPGSGNYMCAWHLVCVLIYV